MVLRELGAGYERLSAPLSALRDHRIETDMTILQPRHIRFRSGWRYARNEGQSYWQAFRYGLRLAFLSGRL